MPIFDFKCDSCGKEQEELVELDTSEIKCTCGETMKRKITNSVNIKFKGTGFYCTDKHKK